MVNKEEGLVELTDAMAAAMQLAPDGMIVVDHEGRIVHANARMHAILGHKSEDLIGQQVEMLLPERFRGAHPGHRRGFMSHGSQRAMGEGQDLVALHKDGREVPVDIQLSPTYGSAGPLVMASLRDVTVRRQYEHDLRNFASFASHDLRAPLRHIYLIARTLAEDDGVPERVVTGMRDVMSHAARMDELMEALLAYERARAGATGTDAIDLDDVMAGVANIVAIDLETTGGKLEIAPLPSVRGDVRLVAELFRNLIENAIRYRDRHRAPLIRVTGVRDGLQCHISIADNGVGFDPAEATTIFDAFHRLPTDRTGTGLGLAVCQRIVERHGGRIWAEGRPGEGATFNVTLPSAEGDAES